VFRKLGLLTALAGAGVFAPWAAAQSQSSSDAQAPAQAKTQTQAAAQQDQPSLADAARQTRQNKQDRSAAPAKRILTEDDMASGHSGSSSSSSLGGGTSSSISSSSRSASRSGAGDNTPMGQAWAGIGRAEDSLDQLAPLDRASLAKVVLEGNDTDFPGRRAWEEKLYIAKEKYVAESRQLVDEMKSVMDNAQSFQAPSGASKATSESPQAQELVGRAQRLLQQAKTIEANFKAVMQEGIDQSKLVSRH
jgi:hypothetical protein